MLILYTDRCNLKFGHHNIFSNSKNTNDYFCCFRNKHIKYTIKCFHEDNNYNNTISTYEVML